MLGWPEIIGVLIVVLVLFGARSRPDMAHHIGSGDGIDLDVVERILPWIICVLFVILVLGTAVHFLLE
jgi:hypothetical protein